MAESCPSPRRMVCKLAPAKKLPAALAGSMITGPCRAALIARALIGDLANEHFLVYYLSAANCPIAYDIFTTGARAHVIIDPGNLLRGVIVAGADGFITVHNHPSGRAEPSDADHTLYAELGRRAGLLSLSHLDDLVLGVDEFWARSLHGRPQAYTTCSGSALTSYLGGVRRRKRR